MFQECAFHVDILDQIRAPAKRAVEKFPVSTVSPRKWRHPVLVQVNWAWSHKKKAFWPKKVKLPDFAQHIFVVQHRSACWQSSYVFYQECQSQSLS